MRVFLEYDDNSVKLESGETLIGRGLSCKIRFNDPAVSRHHLRFLVTPGSALVEELSTTNGAIINGEKLVGARMLSDGDVIDFGHQTLQVRLLADDIETFAEEEIGEETIRSSRWVFESTEDDENTDLRDSRGIGKGRTNKPTPVRAIPSLTAPLLGDVSLPEFTQINCPRCGKALPIEADKCIQCHFHLPKGRPMSVTQLISLDQLKTGKERRREPRLAVDMPVLYTSETLTFDAVSRDLSHGGTFIATEILDPVGTLCHITLLPDGRAPVSAEGIVCHTIISETGEDGRPPGLGIKFSKIGIEARNWLTSFLGRPAPKFILEDD